MKSHLALLSVRNSGLDDTFRLYFSAILRQVPGSTVDFTITSWSLGGCSLKYLNMFSTIERSHVQSSLGGVGTHINKKSESIVSEKEWVKLITLPTHSGMTDDDIDYVVYWVNRFIEDEYK